MVLPDDFKPLLAMDYSKTKNQCFKDWYMSEKLDGIRCIFYEEKFYSRTGKPLHAPDWFLKNIKDSIRSSSSICMLDGELFTKRNDFQNICSIVKKDEAIDEEWKLIVYRVFDAPLETTIFQDRLTILQKDIIENNYIKIVPHRQIVHDSDIVEYLDYITNELNGEGVMLRNPNSFYEQKRSNTLLKVKKFEDAEAIILGVELGKGKYVNAIGKLRVKWCSPPHTQFKVGSGLTDMIRNTADKDGLIGKKIKVKYCGTTLSGKPRFPVFIGFYEESIH